MRPTTPPLEDLEAERQEWLHRLAVAAERWVNAQTAGQDAEHYVRAMRDAERNSRRLERRIKRRKG
jgi:hypothetical protein